MSRFIFVMYLWFQESMSVLITLIDALGNDFYEAEREHTVLLIHLTHTDVVVGIGLEVFIAYNLAVAVLINADGVTCVIA